MAKVQGPLFSVSASGSIGNLMTYKPDLIAQRIALGLRGKIGNEVIQGVAPGLGNVLTDPTRRTLLRRHVVPTDPQTPAQLACRARHAAATVAWRELQPAAVKWWNDLAIDQGMTGYAAFLSHVLKAGKRPLGATWDAGASHWDDGASIWDVV